MNILLWLFVKIPLLLIALVGIVRLFVIHSMYDVIEGECLNSQPMSSDGKGKFLTTYQVVDCTDNVIETVECNVITTHQVDLGDVNKLLRKKIGNREYDKYEIVYGAWMTILIPLIIVLLL